jgi:hypothetical protein
MKATGTLLVTISLALWALFASGARAAEAEWLLGTETLAELKLEKEKAAFGGAPLAIQVPAWSLTITCQNVGGSAEIVLGGSYRGTVELTGCEAKKYPFCKAEVELSVSAEFSETNAHLYDAVRPSEKGQPLGTVFIVGAFCPLPEELEVTGSVAAEASTDVTAELPVSFSQEFSKEVNKEGPTLALFVEGEEAFLDGGMTLAPDGAHSGQQIARPPQTKLCKTDSANPLPCPTMPVSKVWPATTTLEMTLEEPVKFILGFFTVKCTEGVFAGQTESESGRPLAATFATMYFAGCTRGAEECQAGVVTEPWSVFIWRSAEYGRGFLYMPTLYEFECLGMHCVYAAAPADFEVKGGQPMKASRQSIPMIVAAGSDEGCEDDAVWKGEGDEKIKFKFTEPTQAFVTR